jgi:hypothetical protein
MAKKVINMGFMKKEQMPKPTMDDRDLKIAELEQHLNAIKKEREAQKPSPEISEPPLPPIPPKYQEIDKKPVDEPKIQYVPVSWEEILSIRLDSMQQALLEILKKLER